MPGRFALDQNFPQPIVASLSEFMAEAELVPVMEINPRLAEVDDWEILLSLHLHDEEWDGLITTDSAMLSLPRELCVLLQTRLTLVVADAAGHDPLKATGLLLTYLPWIAQRTTPEEAQLWTLRAANKPHVPPWEQLERVAQRQNVSASTLYATEKLTTTELQRNPLD